MDASKDGRQVYCVVKDGNGSTRQSDTVTLNIDGEKFYANNKICIEQGYLEVLKSKI